MIFFNFKRINKISRYAKIMIFPLSINNRIEGIVNIDKPLNTNSLEIITKIKKKTRKKKYFLNLFLTKNHQVASLFIFKNLRFSSVQ